MAKFVTEKRCFKEDTFVLLLLHNTLHIVVVCGRKSAFCWKCLKFCVQICFKYASVYI